VAHPVLTASLVSGTSLQGLGMNTLYLTGAILSVSVLIYLLVALLKPEKFD
jgi:K+-transporting ATPase KdpF subunit